MPDLNALKRRAIDAIDSRKDELIAMSLRIHETPEIAFQEHKSSAMLADWLDENGFKVQRGMCDLPTAFRAEFGSGSPTLAFVAEYDALPGVGHACGHNIIGTASCTAGIIVKDLLEEAGGGTVVVMGTPAEEAAGGKVYMIDRGGFAGIDFSMMVHPGSRNTSVGYGLACLEFEVEFIGRSAHAAAAPDAGINALDAMVQAFVAVGLLRQQVRDSARIHGIITDGGQAVNVIPDHTAAKFLIRTEEDDYMDEILKPKFLACFEGAAKATGCELKYKFNEEARYKTIRTNMAMADAYKTNVESLGRTVVKPDSKRSMGSTDMGNVTHIMPGIHPAIQVSTPDVPIHTIKFREFARGEAGHNAMLDAAKAMAMTGIDILVDADLRERMKREFAAKP